MLDPAVAQVLAPVLAAIAFAAVVLMFMWPYISGDVARDKRVAGVSDNKARRTLNVANDAAASRRKNVAESLKEIDTRAKNKDKASLTVQLQRAGFDATVKEFWIASLVSGAVCGLGVSFGLSAPLLASGVAAFIGTFGLPRWFLKKAIDRRQKKFLGELANSIDVVVRGVKSGLPLNDCLHIIARESPEPIAGEFREVVEQQRLGVPLAECLERMAERMPLSEVRFLTIVIAIQQQAGGNLSEALGNLSNVLRDRFRLQLKVKALSAEAKASALVLASLPPMVMVMVSFTAPEYIGPLFSTTAGKFLIGVGASWMLMGVLVMRKMINFKF